MNNTTILPPKSEFCIDIFKRYFPLQHLIPGIAGLLQVLRLFHHAVFPQVRFAIKKKMPDTFLRGILYLQKKKKPSCVDKMESCQVKTPSFYSLNLFTLPVSGSGRWSVSSSCYLHLKFTIVFTSAPLDSS